MHACGNVWHDIVVNGLLLLSFTPFLRAFALRVRASLSKEHKCPEKNSSELKT